MKQGRWRQVEELFHAALERAPEERQAFFVQACGEDTELRLQVEHLISIDQRAGSRLERPVTEEVFATLDADAPLEGAQVGPYRILSPLGAGGMGKVYRARDTKLGRDVAIKTLPSEFARNPERLARLRREAQTLASLNHPHIAAIYGLEESADLDCLVLELVEGEALCGPLPMPIALDRAGQVAEALEAAHDKGIIHRDLKPANVKVTPQGRVKVLDFGLAKVIWRTESNPDLSDRTPLIGVETTAGLVGTPGYMSPEQARGGEVDQRTDIWAFGCLFYELLTGSRAFPGDTVAETIAAVMDREPDWQALPAKTPAKIRELLRQCLQKDANRRLHNIADARRTSRKRSVDGTAGESRRLRPRRWRCLPLVRLSGCAVPARPPDRSEWVQLTQIARSGEPAGAFAGWPYARLCTRSLHSYGLGQVYVKQLPDGEPVQLTHDGLKKDESGLFARRGAHRIYRGGRAV